MLALLSPAKSLDLSPHGLPIALTESVLMKDTASLMRTTRGLSQTKLRELMGLSPQLAKLNFDRYHSFELPLTDDNAVGAALTFDGAVYKGLSARTLSPEDLLWSQQHLGLLSGLFGILRPLDRIQPHRLEMGTRLKTRRGANLYRFWGDKISKRIDEILSDHADPTLINLASGEYFKAVDKKALKHPILTCIFEDWKVEGQRNVISFAAKYARGLMARYIIEGRIDRAEGLKDFAVDRYRFQPELSTDDTWVFSRKFIPVSG